MVLCVNSLQVFAYDYCFWSMDESQKDKFAGWFFFQLFVLSMVWCIRFFKLASTFSGW